MVKVCIIKGTLGFSCFLHQDNLEKKTTLSFRAEKYVNFFIFIVNKTHLPYHEQPQGGHPQLQWSQEQKAAGYNWTAAVVGSLAAAAAVEEGSPAAAAAAEKEGSSAVAAGGSFGNKQAAAQGSPAAE